LSTQPVDEAELIEALDRFCSGFAGRDADAILSALALEPDLIVVTSEEPLLRGPDELRAFLDRYVEGDTTYSWAVGSPRCVDRWIARLALGRGDRDCRSTDRHPDTDVLRRDKTMRGQPERAALRAKEERSDRQARLPLLVHSERPTGRRIRASFNALLRQLRSRRNLAR
jgi:hypothetical protein